VIIAPLAESRTLTILLKRKTIYLDIQNAKNNIIDKDNSNSNNSPRRITLLKNIIQGSRFSLISNIDSLLSSIKSIIPAILLEKHFARPKGTPSIYNKIKFADNIFGTPDT
jgi:phage-related protein